MLLLGRKIGEKIIIDGDIVVTVAAFRDNNGKVVKPPNLNVSIGIEAPRHIEIVREELTKDYKPGGDYEKKPAGAIERKRHG